MGFEWSRFSSKTPDRPWIWISDGKSVWLRHIAYLEDSDRQLLWAEAKIRKPKVPQNFENKMANCTKKWIRKCPPYMSIQDGMEH